MNLSDIKQRPHWSYSSLNQLLNICSLQFYFQRVAKIAAAFASVNLLLGSAYHRTLEQIYLARRNGTAFPPETALKFFTASWRLAVAGQEVRFGKLTAEETEDQGRKLIACCLDNIPKDEEVLSISEPFVVPVTFRDEFMELPLVGEFDLVVYKNTCPVVVDWKTSGTRWSTGQADKSLQATIYTYAYNQKFSVNRHPLFILTHERNLLMILQLKTDLAVREKADGTLISTPESAAPFLEDMRHLAQEAFVVLTLNTKIRADRGGRGDLSSIRPVLPVALFYSVILQLKIAT